MKEPFAVLAAGLVISAQSQGQMPDFDAVELKSSEVVEGVYMVEGFGGNLGVSVGSDGVLLIDSQFPQLGTKILEAVADLSDEPIEYVINTHWHGDHTGANEQIANTGAAIVAHDNVRFRMDNAPQPAAEGALPELTFSEAATFHFNGHTIEVVHPRAAHTDGDAMIFFKDVNVIHAGDVLFNGLYPFIDSGSGGSVDGYIAALEQLIEMSDGQTRIIPGHGPLANRSDVERKLAMLKSARERILEHIEAGKTLEEVKAADPLSDFHGEWSWDFIDGQRFTEILYNDLD